jgi:hypothetical protein
MLKHTGLLPHKCNFPGCEKAFSKYSTLTIHKRIHTGEKRFVCDFEGCSEAFHQSGNLAIHKRTHSGERPFTCGFEGCEKAFTHGSALTRHERRHTGERPFSCNFEGCGMAFADISDFAKHKRTHTGEMPYKCGFEGCDEAFSRSETLTIHKRTHTGERPFTCNFPGCEMAFAQQAHLNSHTLTHTRARPHRCNFEGCDAAFAHRHKLKAHIHFYHTKEGQRERKREEVRIAKLFKKNNISFKREHHVSFHCSDGTFARMDFIIIVNGRVIIVEVDEDQHRTYDIGCDVARMTNVFEAWVLDGNTLPVRIIRYNPHAFRVDGQLVNLSKKDREVRLLEAVKDAVERDGDGMQVQYMYYDMEGGVPVVYKEESFEPIRECCVEPIFK